ncbi:DUF3263 domain-containing protein [Mycolicibacterium peregrinum]|uniref:DUF3263 domain-containing protein n=1 Tax=Mycolicibacterium peregrinum TaxID=43304 RepID=UPI003AAC29DF
MDPLTGQQHAMLDLEREWFATAGGKEDAIRALGLTPVRYYQKLNQLITTEAAIAHDPLTTNRLRRRTNPVNDLSAPSANPI